MNLVFYTWPLVTSLAVLVIIGQVTALALAALIAYESSAKRTTGLTSFVGRNALVLMLIVALVATGGSLFFSEVAGFAPCKYCWIQRILMYPQVVVLAIALWKRDATAARYILALSLIGAAYAAYHYYIQLYDIIASPTNPATPCDASGESCVKTPFMEFGYITIPMMALTGFVLNVIGSSLALRKNSRHI
jgi:disulfide bond formation protein DsbB